MRVVFHQHIVIDLKLFGIILLIILIIIIVFLLLKKIIQIINHLVLTVIEKKSWIHLWFIKINILLWIKIFMQKPK